jgi:cytochrome b561
MSESTKYGKFDKFLHWFMAINIFATLIFSRGMSELPERERVIEYGDHGLSVTTIALFLIVRICWRAKVGFPPLPEGMGYLEKLAAKLVHYGLYVLLVLQISVGIFLASTTSQDFIANGYGINYTRFQLAPKDMYETLLTVHIALYWMIVAMLVAHIAAALKHHFWDKDSVLTRMLPWVREKSDARSR